MQCKIGMRKNISLEVGCQEDTPEEVGRPCTPPLQVVFLAKLVSPVPNGFDIEILHESQMVYTACTQLHPISIHLSGANFKRVSLPSIVPISQKKCQLPPVDAAGSVKRSSRPPTMFPFLFVCNHGSFADVPPHASYRSVDPVAIQAVPSHHPSQWPCYHNLFFFHIPCFAVVLSVTPRWYSWIRLPALSQCLYSPTVQVFFLVHILYMYVPLVVVSCSVSCQVKSRCCEPITPVRGYGYGGQECSSCCCP